MGHFTVIITITAIVLALIGGVYFVASNFFSSEPPPEDEAPTELPAEPKAMPPAPPKEGTPPPPEPSAPSVEEKIKSVAEVIEEVATSGERQEVTLVFTEAEVNERASTLLTQIDIPQDIPLTVKSVRIDLQPGNNLVAQAETVAADFNVTLEIKAQVGVKEGKPDVTISSVSLGNPLLDALLKDRITALLTERLGDLLMQLTEYKIDGDGIDLEFQEINTQEDKLTVTILVKKVS